MKRFLLSVAVVCAVFAQMLDAKSSFHCKSYSKSSYTKKAPYAGMGKRSSANGMIKAKGVSGHVKHTSKGYTYVNPYAKSK